MITNTQKALQLIRITRKELSEATGAPLGSCACWIHGSRKIPTHHLSVVNALVMDRLKQIDAIRKAPAKEWPGR